MATREIQQQALAVQRHKLGPDHPETLSSMNNLAVLYMFIGRLQDALKIHRELLSIRQAKLGPNHVETISSMANIAVVLDRLGRYPELRNSADGLPHEAVAPGCCSPIVDDFAKQHWQLALWPCESVK